MSTASTRSTRSPTATAARDASSTWLYLVEQGLLDQPVLSLSRAIIRRRTDYYRLLNAVTRDEASPAYRTASPRTAVAPS